MSLLAASNDWILWICDLSENCVTSVTRPCQTRGQPRNIVSGREVGTDRMQQQVWREFKKGKRNGKFGFYTEL